MTEQQPGMERSYTSSVSVEFGEQKEGLEGRARLKRIREYTPEQAEIVRNHRGVDGVVISYDEAGDEVGAQSIYNLGSNRRNLQEVTEALDRQKKDYFDKMPDDEWRALKARIERGEVELLVYDVRNKRLTSHSAEAGVEPETNPIQYTVTDDAISVRSEAEILSVYYGVYGEAPGTEPQNRDETQEATQRLPNVLSNQLETESQENFRAKDKEYFQSALTGDVLWHKHVPYTINYVGGKSLGLEKIGDKDNRIEHFTYDELINQPHTYILGEKRLASPLPQELESLQPEFDEIVELCKQYQQEFVDSPDLAAYTVKNHARDTALEFLDGAVRRRPLSLGTYEVGTGRVIREKKYEADVEWLAFAKKRIEGFKNELSNKINEDRAIHDVRHNGVVIGVGDGAGGHSGGEYASAKLAEYFVKSFDIPHGDPSDVAEAVKNAFDNVRKEMQRDFAAQQAGNSIAGVTLSEKSATTAAVGVIMEYGEKMYLAGANAGDSAIGVFSPSTGEFKWVTTEQVDEMGKLDNILSPDPYRADQDEHFALQLEPGSVVVACTDGVLGDDEKYRRSPEWYAGIMKTFKDPREVAKQLVDKTMKYYDDGTAVVYTVPQ